MSFDARDLRTKGVIELTRSGKLAKIVLPSFKQILSNFPKPVVHKDDPEAMCYDWGDIDTWLKDTKEKLQLQEKPLYFYVVAFKNMVYSRRIKSVTVYELGGEDFKKNAESLVAP